MPVTAKLSKLFYDRLGEQIADELVNWFNQVDATYRGELREINELNHARFEAKLEQGLGTLEARFEAKLEQGIGTLEARINERLAMLEAKLERRLGEQTRWFFIAWASLLVTIIGLSTRR